LKQAFGEGSNSRNSIDIQEEEKIHLCSKLYKMLAAVAAYVVYGPLFLQCINARDLGGY